MLVISIEYTPDAVCTAAVIAPSAFVRRSPMKARFIRNRGFSPQDYNAATSFESEVLDAFKAIGCNRVAFNDSACPLPDIDAHVQPRRHHKHDQGGQQTKYP